jgi:hypothetical protein
MANDAQKSNEDGKVEDLLSELKNIFSRLSPKSEEPEKEALPAPLPAEQAKAPKAESLLPPPKIPVPKQIGETRALSPAPAPNAAPQGPAPAADAPSVAPAANAPATAADPGEIRSVGIAFPYGRESESLALVNKLESLIPKFTKVSFRLAVRFLTPYHPKADITSDLFEEAGRQKVEALFFIVDHSFDEQRRTAIKKRLDPAGIYFHEIPLNYIEKKAFFPDLLLGLIFFFDARKKD